MDRRVVDEVISTEYKEDVEYFCDYAFENMALLHQGKFIVLVKDVAIEKYLIGIQWLSIYIGVVLCPTTSIGTYMGRCGR